MLHRQFVIALALAACGKAASEKRTLEVRVRTEALVGATITVDGQQKGVAGQDPSYQWFALSANAPAMPTVHVDVETPCGPKPLAGVVQKPDPNQHCEGGRICVVLELPDQAQTTSRLPIWTDVPANAKVRVGETIAAPIGLLRPNCAPSLDVTIDGRKVGILEADKPTKNIAGSEAKVGGVLVVADPAACYRLASIAYGDAPSLGATILGGANVYPLAESTITFFLEPAREEVLAQKYEKGKTLTELQRVNCPAATP